jgi:hypothetical protein
VSQLRNKHGLSNITPGQNEGHQEPYGTIFAIGGERSQNRVFARFFSLPIQIFRRQSAAIP